MMKISDKDSEIEKRKWKYRRAIGQIIAVKRKKINMRQEELGRRLGVSGTTIGRYEKGSIDMPAAFMPMACEECKFQMRDFEIGYADVRLADNIKLAYKHTFAERKEKIDKPALDKEYQQLEVWVENNLRPYMDEYLLLYVDAIRQTMDCIMERDIDEETKQSLLHDLAVTMTDSISKHIHCDIRKESILSDGMERILTFQKKLLNLGIGTYK